MLKMSQLAILKNAEVREILINLGKSSRGSVARAPSLVERLQQEKERYGRTSKASLIGLGEASKSCENILRETLVAADGMYCTSQSQTLPRSAETLIDTWSEHGVP